MNKSRIVIVGRPNVGKSTLFNRLIGKRRALVHNLPGVTRDRHEQDTQWWYMRHSYPITLIDTGGLGGDVFSDEIEYQVNVAIERADAILVIFDGHAGLTPRDREVVKKFTQSGVLEKIPSFAVVNKVDDESHEPLIADFYALGFDQVVTISAEHGRGIDDLKELVLNAIPNKVATEDSFEKEEAFADEETFSSNDQESEFEESALDVSDIEDAPSKNDSSEDMEIVSNERKIPQIAILGRPNVGKSTLTNAILGEKRMITSPIAGTTVDAIDSLAELNGKPFIIVDTAGIRKKSKTEQGVEVLSVVQARKALERADVAILLLDGEAGMTDQDEKIGGLIQDAGCSVILAVNKWDTQRKNPKFTKEIAAAALRKEIGYLKYAPVMFLSAKEGKGFEDLGDLIEEILYQRRVKISTKEFTEWVRKQSTIHNPNNVKFFMSHQTGRNPPTFVCHVSTQKNVHFSLQRHLVNAMRERWGFMGTPIRLLFVEGSKKKK